MNPQAAGKDYHSDIKNRPDVQHIRFTQFHEIEKHRACGLNILPSGLRISCELEYEFNNVFSETKGVL